MLLALLLYSESGFPLYEDTDLGRATAHQLYCFAIEVGFGANAEDPQSITKPPLLQRSRLTGGGSPNLVGLVERKSL